jgi:MFS family permease
MKELVTSERDNGSDKILEESSERSDPEEREEMYERVPTPTKSERDGNLRESLRAIFSWRNYSVYLITSWTYSGFAVIYSFFTLYLSAIGWEFIVIGGTLTAIAGLHALSRFLGGYVGDITNRKNLAVIAMFMMATYHLVIGIFTDFIFIIGALALYSFTGIAQGGSSAFIMDNIPKEHSGLALSLFRMGSSFGILTLLVFGVLIDTMEFEFDLGIRTIYLFSGVILFVCALGRAIYLEGGSGNGRNKEKSIWRDFLSENRNAVRLIKTSMPAVLAIVILDGLSDSIFSFGAVLYTGEFLDFAYGEINVMLLVPLVISIPLLFRIGRMSDLMGMRRTTILVYSIMPVCAALLMIAPTFMYWVPDTIVTMADSLLPGVRIMLTTPFLALVLKSTNDILWGLVLLTLIQKNMPRTDTSKILAVLWSIVYFVASLGPFIGGAIFEFLNPPLLFAIVLAANLVILSGVAFFGVERKEPEGLEEKMQSMELTIQKIKDEIEEFRTRRGLPG